MSKICEKCGAIEDTGAVLFTIIGGEGIKVLCHLCLLEEYSNSSYTTDFSYDTNSSH